MHEASLDVTVNNKGTDQTPWMPRLVCSFVVLMQDSHFLFCEEAHILIIYVFVSVVPKALDPRLPMILLLVTVKKHDHHRHLGALLKICQYLSLVLGILVFIAT